MKIYNINKYLIQVKVCYEQFEGIFTNMAETTESEYMFQTDANTLYFISWIWA